jgi:hypothetical protein
MGSGEKEEKGEEPLRHSQDSHPNNVHPEIFLQKKIN